MTSLQKSRTQLNWLDTRGTTSSEERLPGNRQRGGRTGESVDGAEVEVGKHDIKMGHESWVTEGSLAHLLTHPQRDLQIHPVEAGHAVAGRKRSINRLHASDNLVDGRGGRRYGRVHSPRIRSDPA